MSESQEDIDALLAEVNALADEAVAEIVGVDVSATEELESSVSPALGDVASPQTPAPQREKPSSGPSSSRLPDDRASRILRLQVPVIVQLAENTMPLAEIVGLSTGAIIEFEKPADGELDLMINNKCIGKGQAVKVGENFGLRVTLIGSLHDRIKAMGEG